jgi:uncharacterized iron-regulated membrane protein
VVARAQAHMPDAQLARFVIPSGPAGTYGVVLARNAHGDWDSSDEVTFYFDRYSGDLLGADEASGRTAGDVFLTWLGLLHVGTFGGITVKIIWFAAGLAMPVVAVTGVVMWWNRVVKRSLIE